MRPTDAFKLPVLISYAYLRKMKPDVVESIVNNPDIELLLDSGAFTALNAGEVISLSEYMDFVGRWGSKLAGYIALDVLGDPVKTEAQLAEMHRAGLKPVPVHVYGDDGARMDDLFAMSEWVALGGLRRPHRGRAPPEYVKQKMAWAKGRRVHWLGHRDEGELRAFKPYSCDVSSWASAQMFGLVDLYVGRGEWVKNKSIGNALRAGVIARRDVQNFIHAFNIDERDFTDERHWHNGNKAIGLKSRDPRCMASFVPMCSWVAYSLDFRAHFGTRIFLAVAPGDVGMASEVLARYRSANARGLM